VEGSLWCDTASAADMLRNLGGAELANVKLATIADALLTITKRQDRADADALARVEAVVERSMQLKGYSPIN
jgi:hypothetical protein